MPQVIVKLWPGKSEAQKRGLSDATVRDVTEMLNGDEDLVSVGFEDVSSNDWSSRVYAPDIQGRLDTLTTEPG